MRTSFAYARAATSLATRLLSLPAAPVFAAVAANRRAAARRSAHAPLTSISAAMRSAMAICSAERLLWSMAVVYILSSMPHPPSSSARGNEAE